MTDQKRIALETISEACERYQCRKVFALFSGGDDSLAALRVAVEHPCFRAAVHCNTGVGVEATREFVHDTCHTLGIPLLEYKATENVNGNGQPDPQVYEHMVMEYGFPGPTKFGHGKMYDRLKGRGIRRLFREHVGKRECAVLASGCRQSESTRRMGTATRIQQGEPGKDGAVSEKRRIRVNHIFDWSKTDTLLFREQFGLRRNPVAAKMCRSMECNCGGFGNEGELEEMLLHDECRQLGRFLLDLEKRVIAAGFPWRWHERPPKWWMESRNGQRFMFEMNKYAVPGLMCQGCESRAEQLVDHAIATTCFICGDPAVSETRGFDPRCAKHERTP